MRVLLIANVQINPQQLPGRWVEGWALDLHTLYSIPIDPLSNLWDTKRPPIAEKLYLLKYRNEISHAREIAAVASSFLKRKNWKIDVIIPIPPSNTNRTFQPVYEIAKHIGQYLNIFVDTNVLRKVKSTSELKDIIEPEKRREILKDAFSIDTNALLGKNVLIFDKYYRSGETLSAAFDAISSRAKANKIYVLTITKTRSKR